MRMILVYLVESLLLASSIAGVRSILDGEELIFTFDNQFEREGIISVETETEPLLISVKKSDGIGPFLDIRPEGDLRITKKEPVVLYLTVKNPPADIYGFITINLLYEKLPQNVNYYGDDTIRIPINLLHEETEPLTKLSVKLTEELLPGEKTTPLDVGVFLPVVLLIALLFVFRSRWYGRKK